jgi:AbiJ N-terminal domain 3
MKDASSTTRISNVIRRKLVEVFNEHCWWGNLDEIDFLKRIYELSKLPSTDNRYDDSHWDIIQHRVNNNDWSDDWVFNDERFNLKSDDSLLRFLAETVHPEVRSDPTEVYALVRKINGLLRRDGWVLIPNCGEQSCFIDCSPDQREWQKHGIGEVNEVMERSGITECSR